MNAPARFPTASGDWALRIAAAWRASLESVFETGRLLGQAKAALSHGEFGVMIETELPFTASTAQRLMAVASDVRLTNPAHVQHLPPHWGTLYELTKLDDDEFRKKLGDGTIRPDMERKDISTERKQAARAERETELAARQRALPRKKYGVVHADPEWRFEPYSRETGLDRAADNHYPTSSIEAIARRPVASIAADDAVLFLWGTVPMLQQAFYVMEAWGFARVPTPRAEALEDLLRVAVEELAAADGIVTNPKHWSNRARLLLDEKPAGRYVSHACWEKDKLGTGYWFRNAHELLLVGVRGSIPAPAMGTQWASLIEGAVGEHSAKPDRFYELIESYFPNLPKIELNARRARKGWAAWGNEAPQ